MKTRMKADRTAALDGIDFTCVKPAVELDLSSDDVIEM